MRPGERAKVEGSINNILAIDLEDWNQLAARRLTGGGLAEPSRNLFRQLDILLNLLDETDTKATFFVMGALAEQCPELVLSLADEGHEIASHGHQHLFVSRLSPLEFRADTERSKKVLEDLSGRSVRGYRAAEFSIRKNALWALETLAELGFEYDSSIMPIRHRRYGIPGFDPRIRRYTLPSGGELIELPPSTVSVAGIRLPVAGGGYVRCMPSALVGRIVQHLNRHNTPMVSYFHPYEFDSRPLNVFETAKPCGWREQLRGFNFNLKQNLRRNTVLEKVRGMIESFPFTSFDDYLRETPVHESRPLF